MFENQKHKKMKEWPESRNVEGVGKFPILLLLPAPAASPLAKPNTVLKMQLGKIQLGKI